MLKRTRRFASLVAAVVVSALLLGVLGFGYGAIPALGPALDPGRGAWTAAADGQRASSQRLNVPGLDGPVTVSFSAQGLASIQAGGTHDADLALGYVQARYRLTEMDAERRLGEGRLSQLAGASDLASDRFELQLGLLRTAQNEWARATPAERATLTAFSAGVNDDLAQVRAAGDWPSLFTLTGQYPAAWTPVDSLVIQGVLTQELDYTTGALDQSLLTDSLGAATSAAFFPTLALNAQTPYDPGPYQKLPLAQIPADVASSAPGATKTAAATSFASGSVMSGAGAPDITEISTSGALPGAAKDDGATSGTTAPAGNERAVSAAVSSVLNEISQLKPDQTHQYPDSNAWAANGPAVQGGGAILGGDPHLPQTEPSVWFEVALSAPGYDVSGVSVPGVPGILIGHNNDIAWSLTDTQDSATFYYQEKVKGNDYFAGGAWQPMTVVHYDIPVRGGATRGLTVDITAQGPIISQHGEQLAVDWMGNAPSDDLGALVGVNTATNFTQFKAALQSWHAPTMNFVYADNAGNIGVIAPGYYAQVPAGCTPALPMPGAGGCDIDGVIPYQAIPQAYDPPTHLIATDNQRPVAGDYPYYIGTTLDFFDPGYRAAYAYATLAADEPLTPAKVAALQNSLTDPLAQRVLPAIDQVVVGAGLTGADAQAAELLKSWNDEMNAGSAAASLWWTFWGSYLNKVFAPWWQAAKVPDSKDGDLAIAPGNSSLDEDLEAWTLNDPTNAAFAGPKGTGQASDQAAIVAAFRKAVSHLSTELGGTPSTWTWGKLHTREFPSITGAAGLGYGPRAAGGDPFAEDAADGGLNAETGPSWRMIVAFGGGAVGAPPAIEAGTPAAGAVNGVYAVGVYPGGQSENPASPWYQNLIEAWWTGQYLAMPVAGKPAGSITWSLGG
jgi:penicillin amidase